MAYAKKSLFHGKRWFVLMYHPGGVAAAGMSAIVLLEDRFPGVVPYRSYATHLGEEI